MPSSPKRPKGKPSAGHTMWEVADNMGISVNRLRNLRQLGHITDPTDLKRSIHEYLFYISEGGTRACIDREKLKKLEMENAKTEGRLVESEFVAGILDRYIAALTLGEDALATKITRELDGVTDPTVRKQLIKAAIIDARNASAQKIHKLSGAAAGTEP